MRRLSWFLAPALALAWLAGAASAVTMPGGAVVTWQVATGENPLGTAPWTSGVTNNCTSPGGDVTQCVGDYTWSGAKLTWNLSTDPDPFVTNIITVQNNTAFTQTYVLLVTLPIAPAGPSTLIGGSIQGGLTSDASAGTLSSSGTTAIYTAYIDGVAVATLFDAPTSTSSGAFLSSSLGTADFGTPIPSAAGPAATTDIAIQLKFTLTPGDLASFTSIFVVEPIPEPTTIGLVSLGLAGLALAGRRRRA
jgi:hypothetical protein